MNEILFFIHIAAAVFIVGAGLRFGSQGLTATVAFLGALSNLFVLKQMDFFGLTVTCSDVYAVGGILSLNLLQEYYGRDAARRGAWMALLLLCFFALSSKIQLAYTPSPSDTGHSAYSAILSHSPRLLAASVISFFIMQKVDIALFARLKEAMGRRGFTFRSMVSMLSSQLIDTALFSILGLVGLVSSIVDIILFSFLIKAVIALSMSAITAFARKLLPQPLS